MLLVTLLVLAACKSAQAPAPSPPTPVTDPLAYADPRFGSGGFGFAAGSCFPGAAAPNGLVKIGPDTTGEFGALSFLHYDGYWAGDDTVNGFSHVHLSGTGATDYGVLAVMPLRAFDSSKLTAEANAQHFDKASEVATPGYYATTLADGTRAEFTASTHVAHHRYTFDRGAAGNFLLIDLTHHLADGAVTTASVTLTPTTHRISGVLHSSGGMSRGFGGYDVFFEGTTKQPWRHSVVWNDANAPADGTSIDGAGASCVLEIDNPSNEPVEMDIAISFVSNAGAAANLLAEDAHHGFDEAKSATELAWRARLKNAIAWGGTEEQRSLFYSALHHAFVMQTIASDADGQFTFAGHDDTANGWNFVTDLSLWDTYRTLNPLYSLLAPDAARDVVLSLDHMATLGGSYPLWAIATGDSHTMLGASADIVIADAALKNVSGIHAEESWQRLRAAALDATAPAGGRGGRDTDFSEYASLHYVSADNGQSRSVSTTIEFAQDDFALSNLAAKLGHNADAATLLDRSHGYRALFDPATHLLRAKMSDGTLKPGAFDPANWSDFAEADAYQSVWGAPHDIDGTADLFGGKSATIDALEHFFENSVVDEMVRQRMSSGHPNNPLNTTNNPRTYYWAGNEPDIHAPYLFALLGRPDLTQKWLPWIRDTYFKAAVDGLPGNDDGGTMSAWYVWSALGFYPLVGSDVYVIGAPVFPKMEIAVSGGTFTIEAANVDANNIYIASATLNGEPLNKATFTHGDIHAGGVLHFEMRNSPSNWGQ